MPLGLGPLRPLRIPVPPSLLLLLEDFSAQEFPTKETARWSSPSLFNDAFIEHLLFANLCALWLPPEMVSNITNQEPEVRLLTPGHTARMPWVGIQA